jgi:hypothetical protein
MESDRTGVSILVASAAFFVIGALAAWLVTSRVPLGVIIPVIVLVLVGALLVLRRRRKKG